MALVAVHTTSKYTIVADKAVCQAMGVAVERDWFSAPFWHNKNAVTGVADGRGTTLFVQESGHDMVLRHYKRGGLVRHFSDDWFVFTSVKNSRPYKELQLLNYMNRANLPVPIGIAGLIEKAGLGYRADILTVRIANAQDVHTLLLTNTLANTVWANIGKAIRLLHDAYVYHHDLNIKNIMQDEAGKIWIIDFDKCARKTGDTWKQQNLDRLLRSLRKQRARIPEYGFDDANWAQLMKGYHN